MLRKLFHIFSYLSLGLVPACGKTSQQKSPHESYESCLAKEMLFIAGSCYDGKGLKDADLRSLLFGDAPLLESLHKPQLEICILAEPQFNHVRPQLERETRSSIQSWLKPLMDVSRSLPTQISFVHPEFSESPITGLEPQGKHCPESSDAVIVYLSDLTSVNFEKEDRAFAWVEEKEIWLSPKNTWPGVILHEFGHLFGLADIYIEDQWNCRKDFPNSIMCQGEWNTLMPVDRVAIKRNYCLYTDGEHPNCFNHERKELLSFLPKRRSNSNSSYRDPYMLCEGEGARFSFQPYSFSLVTRPDAEGIISPHFLGLYASDPSAVEETYSAHLVRNLFTVEDVTEQPKDRDALSLELEIRDEQIHVRFHRKNREWKESFSSCYIDPRMVEYYRSRGMDFPESLIRDGRYFLLKSQRSSSSYEGDIIPAKGLRILRGDAVPVNAEILVFASESHKLVAAAHFDAVTKSHENLGPDHEYIVDVEALKLPAGSYEAYIAVGDSAVHNIWFVMPE